MPHENQPPPRQFGLRTAGVVITLCCVGFTALRQAPSDPKFSLPAILVAAIGVGLITAAVYFVARGIADPKPSSRGGFPPRIGSVTAAMIGTVGGGAVTAVLWNGFYGDDNINPVGPILFAIFGGMWAGLFSPVGFICGAIWAGFRRRGDVWSGAVCGAVTGFVSLGLIDSQTVPYAAIPAFLCACYAALAAAVQLAEANRKAQRDKKPPPDANNQLVASASERMIENAPPPV